MLAIGAFHVSQPGAVVRADGLTSLRIVDGVRRGTLAAGIVRGPVPDPERVASKPLARVPVDHLAVPPAHPLAGADIVNASDLDGQPVLVVDRAEAPTGHDEIKAYCASVSARPNWITHAAVQVERVLDQVALGTGIGWLNAWQAEPAAGRPDIAVRSVATRDVVRHVPRRVADRRQRRDDCSTRAVARRLVCVATVRPRRRQRWCALREQILGSLHSSVGLAARCAASVLALEAARTGRRDGCKDGGRAGHWSATRAKGARETLECGRPHQRDECSALIARTTLIASSTVSDGTTPAPPVLLEQHTMAQRAADPRIREESPIFVFSGHTVNVRSCEQSESRQDVEGDAQGDGNGHPPAEHPSTPPRPGGPRGDLQALGHARPTIGPVR